jgi:hypothetical protein
MMLSHLADDGDNNAWSPGRARISRKPLRREGRACPACTCGSCPVHFFRTGAMGVADTRPSLRPPEIRGTLRAARLGRDASRGCGGVSCHRECVGWAKRQRAHHCDRNRRTAVGTARCAFAHPTHLRHCEPPGRNNGVCGHKLSRHAPPPGLASGEPDDRLRRGIQYAAASRSNTGVSGILDRPVEPGDDSGVKGEREGELFDSRIRSQRRGERNAARVSPSPALPTRSPCASRLASPPRSRERTDACRRGRRNHAWRRDRG